MSISLSKEKALNMHIICGRYFSFCLIPSLFFDFVGTQDINLEKMVG